LRKEIIHLNNNSIFENIYILFCEIILKNILFWIEVCIAICCIICSHKFPNVKIVEIQKTIWIAIALSGIGIFFDEFGHYFYILSSLKDRNITYGLGYKYSFSSRFRIISKFYIFLRGINTIDKLFYFYPLLFQTLFLIPLFVFFLKKKMLVESEAVLLTVGMIIIGNIINKNSDLRKLLR